MNFLVLHGVKKNIWKSRLVVRVGLRLQSHVLPPLFIEVAVLRLVALMHVFFVVLIRAVLFVLLIILFVLLSALLGVL